MFTGHLYAGFGGWARLAIRRWDSNKEEKGGILSIQCIGSFVVEDKGMVDLDGKGKANVSFMSCEPEDGCGYIADRHGADVQIGSFDSIIKGSVSSTGARTRLS